MKSIEEIVQSLDDEACKYCIYEDECPRGVTGHGSGPIYPPCADGSPEDWFDIEAYEEEEN